MKTLKLKGYNDFELSCYVWDKVENPVGVVQIIHGMQEHAKRYSDFAKYLNAQGLIVFASDLRGHGQTALLNNMPFGYSDGDIFMEIVKDQIILTDYLKEKYNLPISIFGHSFGSFITQRYMVENGFKVKNVVLCGTTYTDSMIYRMGYRMAQMCRFFRGKKRPAKMLESISIKGYGKKYPKGNWLSRDENNWNKYTQDELCGMTFPNNFYYSFFKNARHNYKHLENIPYYLPILIIVGTDDPVAGKNGIFRLFVKYGESNKKVYLKSYIDARHELLNETNKLEVYEDACNFIKDDKLNCIPVSVM